MIAALVPLARERFAGLDAATYLVSHSMGAPPLAARDALVSYWQEWAADGPGAWERWLPRIEAIADGIGAIIGAAPGTTYLAPNVSAIQASIASALDFSGPRNRVVYEAQQFPSLTYVWTAWERYGARTVVAGSRDRRTASVDEIIAAIDERTAVVVLSHAGYLTGALIDVAPIAARARECGALLILDVYQTAGTRPVDVTALGVDIAVGGSHKWFCGGPGCGYITVRPGLRDALEPACIGWMAHDDPFSFEAAPIRYAETMARFGTGTPPMPGFIAAQAGHDLIRSIGIEAIRAHNVALTTLLAEEILARGLRVTTPLDPALRTGWIGIDFDGAEAAATTLGAERVFIDYRRGCGIRVGPHFYNSEDDVRQFLRALDRAIT